MRVCRAWEVPSFWKEAVVCSILQQFVVEGCQHCVHQNCAHRWAVGVPLVVALSSSWTLMLMTQGVRISFVRCVVPHNFEILLYAFLSSPCVFSLFSVLRFCPRVRKLSSSLFFLRWVGCPTLSLFLLRQIVSHFLFHFVLPQGRRGKRQCRRVEEWSAKECWPGEDVEGRAVEVKVQVKGKE